MKSRTQILLLVAAPTVLVAAAALTASCSPLKTATSAGPRDNLVGWYSLPSRNRDYGNRVIPGTGALIPVLKYGTDYFSVCRGFEVPLKECPDGLEWAPTPSSMEGTKITYDATAGAYLATIVDRQEAAQNDMSLSGQQQPITRADAPSGLLDPAAPPPRSNDDFVGFYQPVWLPVIRFEVRREGDKYFAQTQDAVSTGTWCNDGPLAELKPLPDGLGFSGFEGSDTIRIIYDDSLRRFELAMGTRSGVMRNPLARVSRDAPAPKNPPRIGIPSWH